MRPAGLFGALLVARVVSQAGTPLSVSFWTPVAYLWQDLAAVLALAALDYAIRREWFGWTLYGLAVAYVALNAGIVRVLSSPLTLTMIRAAGGPLTDSIRDSVTPTNLGAMALVIATGVALPAALVRWRPGRGLVTALIGVSLILIACGPYAIFQVDTGGRYRNAFGALWPVRLTSPENRSHEDWRKSPFPVAAGSAGDLVQYRGAASARNVVMILLESTAAQYWPVSQPAMDPMPNLTALASAAISFQHAYAVYPESIKGLLSILCSQYPAYNVRPDAYSGNPCPALPQQLQKAGYRTALFHSGRFIYLGMPAVIEKRGFEVLEDAGAIGGNIHSSFGVDDSSTVKRILSWIDSLKSDDRFFVTYLPVAGHHPYATPEPGPFPADSATDERSRYLNALHYGDEALGELLEGFRARGLDKNTLFVVFGDHGEAFGQHGGNVGHTLFIYDENVHVPYLIAVPGLIRSQIHVPDAVSLIDTAPTILDLLGLSIPLEFQGTSMLDPQPRMSLFFTDYSLGWLGLVDACLKYIVEINSSHSKLFDVCRNPAETEDVSSEYPERGRVYRARLEAWISAGTSH